MQAKHDYNMLKNSVELSKLYLKNYIKSGDIVADMTCGNGHDTLFLSEIVGENGFIYAFDIQKSAIESTKVLLSGFENLKLINDGHQNLDEYITGEIDAFVFNLGYLPKGDHNIKTDPENTIAAIEKSMLKLKKTGIIVISIYHGGDSGFHERDELLKYFKRLNPKKYNVILHDYINKPNNPPLLAVITHN